MAKQYGTFGLNTDGDMALDSGGNLLVAYDLKAIIQNVTSAIRLWKNEYEFNTTIGMSYTQFLGNFVPFMNSQIKVELTNAIKSISGVKEVVSLTYNYTPSDGALTGSARITVLDGTTVNVGF